MSKEAFLGVLLAADEIMKWVKKYNELNNDVVVCVKGEEAQGMSSYSINSVKNIDKKIKGDE